MFMYTVYPMQKKLRDKKIRNVEALSRVNPVRRIENNISHTPPQQIWGVHEIKDSQTLRDEAAAGYDLTPTRKQNDRAFPAGELYIQGTLPLLVSWRRPKAVISPEYIQKRLDRLHAFRRKQRRNEQTRQNLSKHVERNRL